MSGTTVPKIRTVEVFDPRPPAGDGQEAIRLLTEAARAAGVELVFDPGEGDTGRHLHRVRR